MNKQFLIILILLSLSYRSLSYDCLSFTLGESRKVNYESSEIIFLGTPLNFQGKQGNFLVFEQFKGEINDTVIVNFYNFIDKEDIFSLWLIYGTQKGNGDTIYVDVCSITRSINKPFIISAHSPPPPIPDTEEEDINTFLLNDNLNQIYKNKWRNDFYDEIELLRGLSKFNNKQTSFNNKESLINNTIIYLIVILLILILCSNIYLIFRRK